MPSDWRSGFSTYRCPVIIPPHRRARKTRPTRVAIAGSSCTPKVDGADGFLHTHKFGSITYRRQIAGPAQLAKCPPPSFAAFRQAALKPEYPAYFSARGLGIVGKYGIADKLKRTGSAVDHILMQPRLTAMHRVDSVQQIRPRVCHLFITNGARVRYWNAFIGRLGQKKMAKRHVSRYRTSQLPLRSLILRAIATEIR